MGLPIGKEERIGEMVIKMCGIGGIICFESIEGRKLTLAKDICKKLLVGLE